MSTRGYGISKPMGRLEYRTNNPHEWLLPYGRYARYGYRGVGLKFSRFNDSYVRSNYRVESMVGPKGGGFIFDTNAVHKGEVRGSLARTALVIELTPATKCQGRTSGTHFRDAHPGRNQVPGASFTPASMPPPSAVPPPPSEPDATPHRRSIDGHLPANALRRVAVPCQYS